ncbi:MAG: hypothetical protein IJA86_06185 [Clostridia bacterium]|nr:hypothetical protein [Clostridia bacterium]
MGCWGMGMTQTDEFCEIYEKFMEEYDDGKAVSEITAEILANYHNEFDDDDGVMHDVYFALAKAEWMCCEQSEPILARVREIIGSKANITFYRELEATESDLRLRQKNLEKFWNMLQTPREKPRKRKRTAPLAKKTFPTLEIGDCFAYKYEDGFRVICVLERFRPRADREETVSVALFSNVYSSEKLKNTDFLQENTGKIFTVTASEFLGKSVIRKIAHVKIPSNCRQFFEILYESKPVFRMKIENPLDLTLSELFRHYEQNTNEAMQKLEVGGCYAYRYKNGYQFAVVLDHTKSDNGQYWMIAVLSAFSDTPDIDFLHTDFSTLAVYGKEEIPNLSGWEKVSSVAVPSNMQKRFLGKSKYIINGILDFLKNHVKIYRELYLLHQLAPLLAYCQETTDEAFAKLETYGLYSYPTADGFRLALILDQFLSSCGTECALIALLRKFPFSAGDYMNYIISHVGIYSADMLPNTEAWALVNKMIPADYVPGNLQAFRAKYGAVATGCIQRFFQKKGSETMLTLNQFLRTDYAQA